ncbi:Sodium/hydrogen exchanger 9B2 [Gaertneriomyces sp. JEL0708]|nr:Sodium/hydrogen exchanger 9B2 [Gaertneriomyces sp. JEL0708]
MRKQINTNADNALRNLDGRKDFGEGLRLTKALWTIVIAACLVTLSMLVSWFHDYMSPPGTPIQRKASEELKNVVSVFAPVVLGMLNRQLCRYPLLGMIATGVLLRNAFPGVISSAPQAWTSVFFSFALAAIVARAGLYLSLATLSSHLNTILALGIIPVAAETAWLTLIVHEILCIPWIWSFTVASGVACISPGVALPLLLRLINAERIEWKDSDILRIMLASTSIDVLVSTTMFGVGMAALMESLSGAEPSLTAWLLRGILEMGSGCVAGALLGMLALSLRHWKACYVVGIGLEKDTILFIWSTLWMMGAKSRGYPGAATSGTIIAWAIAGNDWDAKAFESADTRLSSFWYLAEPLLFPLIGTSISFEMFENRMMLTAAICVASSVGVKSLAAFAAMLFRRMSHEEASFTSAVWTGKASVQAALSSIPLTLLHSNLQGPSAEFAKVMFAVFTAAILIGPTAHSALTKTWEPQCEQSRGNNGPNDELAEITEHRLDFSTQVSNTQT